MLRDYKDITKLKDLHAKYDLSLRYKRLETTLILGMFFVMIFGILDFVMYPEAVLKMLLARSCAAAILIAIFLALKNKIVQSIKFFGILIPSIVFILISVLVFLATGASSPYYAGLTLTIVALSTLIAWTFHEAIYSCLIMLVCYIVASISHAIFFNEPYDIPLFINNLFFLISISTFCVFAAYLNSQLRFKEFCLNYELEEKNNRLKSLDQMKTNFFANISHEFRTPLTLILGVTKDALDNSTNDISQKLHDILTIVNQNGLRLLKLVNDLLDIMRLEEGKSELKFEKLGLNNIIGGIADSMNHFANMRHISLDKELAKNEFFVKVDVRAFEKIILNLISNAIKFSRTDGKIIIATSYDDKNGYIEVKDNGIGIKEDDLPYIFDRFRQVDNSATRQYQGTGLGLALVKELTELQHGRVKVSSKINEGTSFILSFPLAAEEEEISRSNEENNTENNEIIQIHKEAERVGGITNSLRRESDNDETESTENNKSGTVLVIDDEPDIRRYTLDLVRQEGYRTMQARDGAMGLKMAQERMPDLIILDLMLPKIDGLTICHTLKSDEKTKLIKIILLTARVDEAAKIKALQNGADDFVTKPFSGLEIKTRLNNLMQNRKLQKEVHDKNEELKDTIHKLQTTQMQLIQSEKINALGNLSAGLLHEVNNPLNYTMMALHLIKMNEVVNADEDLKEIIKDIEEGMNRIKTIVTDLRAFAYPEEADKQNQFSIQGAVVKALRFTSEDCKNIERISDIDQNLIVIGSETHIVQLLINLISNAARAISRTDKKGLITISAKTENNRVVVMVTDNGCGMSPEVLKRVFDPFFTTNEVGKGMGIGLSVSYTIAKNHGGNIMVTSEEGVGTTFSFDLAINSALELTKI